MSREQSLTGVERSFGDDEIIVSKTDARGRITYANRVFMKVAGMTNRELVGQPHSIIRHPDMPRCVFKFLWDRISAGHEVFAYVVNRAKNGDHYWVLAHVTPSFDEQGTLLGYHSSRRVPNRAVVDEVIIPLYRDLLAEEARHRDRKAGMNAAYDTLVETLRTAGVGYDEFIASLINRPDRRAA